MDCDVVVIGAGPAGCMAARTLAEGGADVLVCEEHRSVGSPVQCTGLLSCEALAECEVSDRCVVRTLKRACIHFPSGASVCIGNEKTRAVCVDRRVLDGEMARRAVEAGAVLELASHVKRVNWKEDRVVVEGTVLGKEEQLEARLAVVAEGACGSLSRSLGLGRCSKVLSGAQVDAPYAPEDESGVELFLGSVAPGLFGWAVPSYAGTARLGLAIDPTLTERTAKEHLDQMLRTHGFSTSVHQLVLGPIPIGVLPRTYGDGVLAVGDAAGHVKPTTGGGVYMGVKCAKLAAKTALEALEEDDCSAEKLSAYERAWKKEVGGELARGLKLQEHFSKLSDAQLDEVAQVVSKPEVVRIINEHADMENPSKIVKEIISEMGLGWAALSALKMLRTLL